MFGFTMALLIWALGKHGKKFDPRIGCDGACGNCNHFCAHASHEIPAKCVDDSEKEVW